MKKIITLILFSTILFVGCVNDSVNVKKDSPSHTVGPTATAILYKTDSPDKTPVATPTPSPYYSYPNPFYDKEAWENLTNYRFNSASGVNEKKREDFSTVEEYENHIRKECLKKYEYLHNYVQTHKIDALYIHCNVQSQAEGHILYGNMDVVVTNPVLIGEWKNAVISMPIEENESFSSENLKMGVGTKLLYCINVNGEIIEFFEGQRMGITYKRDFSHDQYPYIACNKKDNIAYNQLDYVNRQIINAVNERYMEIYKDPRNYPYILD